jgi:uncharacterized protein YkwD
MVEDMQAQVVLLQLFLDGSSNSDRVGRYAEWGVALGENISYGTGDATATVMRLLIDDGVETRGHRKNLFNDKFLYIGVGLHSHKTYKNLVVIDYAGEITSKGATKDSVSYGGFNTKSQDKEESKKAEHDSEDGYVDIDDVPAGIREQIEAMNIQGDYKIKKEGGSFQVVYGATGGCPSKDNKSKSSTKDMESKLADMSLGSSSKDEPEGYNSKSVKTQTKTSGKTTTKTTTTTYGFPNGSKQTFTETETITKG